MDDPSGRTDRATTRKHPPLSSLIQSGRFERVEDAVTEAFLLWEERESTRLTLLASLDEAEASLDREEGIPITRRSMRTLSEDVKRLGRERLAAERKHSA